MEYKVSTKTSAAVLEEDLTTARNQFWSWMRFANFSNFHPIENSVPTIFIKFRRDFACAEHSKMTDFYDAWAEGLCKWKWMPLKILPHVSIILSRTWSLFSRFAARCVSGFLDKFLRKYFWIFQEKKVNPPSFQRSGEIQVTVEKKTNMQTVILFQFSNIW